MCVIAVKEAGVSWATQDELKRCFIVNSHGAGISWVDKEGLHIEKGYFSWRKLYADLKRLEEYPVLLHCRFATHGSISRKNCHPFLLRGGAAVAHNGVLDVPIPVNADITDSEAFIRRYIDPFRLIELEYSKVKALIELAIGSSKLAVLKPDGKFIIFNRHLGVEHNGIWFSNTSFKTFYEKKPVFNSFYTGGYGWTEEDTRLLLNYDETDYNDPFFAAATPKKTRFAMKDASALYF